MKSRYRPQDPRIVPIPKPATAEKRILKIGSIPVPGISKSIKTKLTKEKALFTVAEVVSMTLALAKASSHDDPQKQISERTLHLMAFLGGWPGALVAQRQCRHKTQKLSFRIAFWMIVIAHVGIVAAVTNALTNANWE